MFTEFGTLLPVTYLSDMVLDGSQDWLIFALVISFNIVIQGH